MNEANKFNLLIYKSALEDTSVEVVLKGMISHEEAKMKAEAEYDIFNRTQKVLSHFDKLLNKHNE